MHAVVGPKMGHISRKATKPGRASPFPGWEEQKLGKVEDRALVGRMLNVRADGAYAPMRPQLANVVLR